MFYKNKNDESEISGNIDPVHHLAWVHMPLLEINKKSDLFIWSYEDVNGFHHPHSLLTHIQIPFNLSYACTDAELITILKKDFGGTNKHGGDFDVVIVSYDGNIYIVSNFVEPSLELVHVIGDLKEKEICSKIICISNEYNSFVVITNKSRLFVIDILEDHSVYCTELKKSLINNVFGWFKGSTDDRFINIKSVYNSIDQYIFVLTTSKIIGKRILHSHSSEDMFEYDILGNADTRIEGRTTLEKYILDFDTVVSESNDSVNIHVLIGTITSDYHDNQAISLFILTYRFNKRNKSITPVEFYHVPHQIEFTNNKEAHMMLSEMKLLTVDNNDAYIYWNNTYIITRVPTDTRSLDIFRFPDNIKKTLGSGASHLHSLFIIPPYGIVSIKQFKSTEYSVLASAMKKREQMNSDTMDVEYHQEEKNLINLENSFSAYLSSRKIDYHDITVVDEDDIIALATSIVNSNANDPRWAETRSTSSRENALITKKLIEEKIVKYDHFQRFLSQSKLDMNLSLKSKLYICSLREKLESALSLINRFSKLNQIPITFNNALKRYTESQKNKAKLSWSSPIDQYFWNISNIESILLYINLNDIVVETSSVIDLINECNSIFDTILGGVISYRERNPITLEVNEENKDDYKLWTWDESIRNSLIRQIEINMEYTGQKEESHYKEVYKLVYILLQDMKEQYSFIEKHYTDETKDLFEEYYLSMKDQFINYFGDDDESLKYAIELGKKFEEYNILVKVYDKTDNNIELEKYMDMSDEFKFCVFNYYYQNGLHHKLVTLPKKYFNDVLSYLDSMKNYQLKYLYLIHHDEWENAVGALQDEMKKITSEQRSNSTVESLLRLTKIANNK